MNKLFKYVFGNGNVGRNYQSNQRRNFRGLSLTATALIFGVTAFLTLPQGLKGLNVDQAQAAAQIQAQAIQPFEATNQNKGLTTPLHSYFSYGVKMIPHIEKRHRGGEDAYYVDDQLLVVLDGVGGWNNQGVDPGLFSRQLASFIAMEQKLHPEKSLKTILVDAVKQSTNMGSSTASLVRLDQNSQNGDVMKTTNLGDSGYVIFRIETPKLSENSQPVFSKQFRFKEQQYSFNFPYQCGTNCDLPYKADDNEHVLQDQDIVIVGSDGLFDNVFDDDMLSCITPQLSVGSKSINNLFQVADCLANRAETYGHDRSYFSPFSKGAKEAGYNFLGGKLDDVTVVVAQFNKAQNDAKNNEAISENVTTVSDYSDSTSSTSDL